MCKSLKRGTKFCSSIEVWQRLPFNHGIVVIEDNGDSKISIYCSKPLNLGDHEEARELQLNFIGASALRGDRAFLVIKDKDSLEPGACNLAAIPGEKAYF